jgi:RNA polymerase sigma-70 factor (ECF subfamily)
VNAQRDIEKEFIGRIRKHQGILHKICFIYSKNESDKEDLYQEMALQLWKSYPSFKGDSQFSTWMYRVALNTAITYTRKASFFVSDRKDYPDTFDPEVSMDYSEDIRILYRAISQLNKVDKAIILLWLEERPYSEIAEIIGVSVKNVSVKLVRIKEKLAERIRKLQ